ncbi:hypothetical protein ACPAY5_11785 [Staphylococcus caledonicus]|uniref:hypothetical protein n=1 Tax=Staphylococcus caledonicus TaxID=2741333 RepID=UPI003C2DB980
MDRLLKYLVSSILFTVGTFILIFIFDYLKLSPNDSGFLNNLEFINFFKTPEFNGLFTLCLVISFLIFVLGLLGGLKKNKK